MIATATFKLWRGVGAAVDKEFESSTTRCCGMRFSQFVFDADEEIGLAESATSVCVGHDAGFQL